MRNRAFGAHRTVTVAAVAALALIVPGCGALDQTRSATGSAAGHGATGRITPARSAAPTGTSASSPPASQAGAAAPSAPVPTPGTASTPGDTALAAPDAVPPAAAQPHRPPKPDTTAWYLAHLPHFAAAPPPATVTVLPATGPARQINAVPVGGQRVAFITIDDGWRKDPAIAALLKAARVPFTMFLTTDAVASDPRFFTTLEGLGGVVEDHTVTHGKLSQMTYGRQRHEICDARATLTRWYGRPPVIMRAPYGLSNKDTLKAAGSCGIRANVFWNEWAQGRRVTWQRPGGIHPGDMVLLHFDDEFEANFLATLRAFASARVLPALLEDYLITDPSQRLAPRTSGPAPARPRAI
jgi:peptidoglycan/xylan/chitin deacetylase (PgdA/CDA1 family)